MNPSEYLNRKGATKLTAIPKEVKILLDKGLLASVNLTEWLAVDHKILVTNVFTALKAKDYIAPSIKALDSIKDATAMKCTAAIGNVLYTETVQKKDDTLMSKLATHTSDSVRCWATYIIGLDERLTINKKLEAIHPFAADNHFGVREIAWMAVRPSVETHLLTAIKALTNFAKSDDANVRRFASEVTRPRGVWCKHIEALKHEPQLALPILDILIDDPEKYVQDSVGNWLNDASKTSPEWVIAYCNNWLSKNKSKNIIKVTDKALRTLRKT